MACDHHSAPPAVHFQAAVHVPQETQDLQLQLAPLVVATVKNKLGHTLVKQVSKVAPLADLKHLKRTQRSASGQPDELDIIVCDLQTEPVLGELIPAPCISNGGAGATQPAGTLLPAVAAQPSSSPSPSSSSAALGDCAAIMQHLPPAVRDMLRGLGVDRLRVERGSRLAPRTREQWAEWSAHWPITWRVPEGPPPKREISSEQQAYLEAHMQRAVQLSRCQPRGSCNVALIVDPAANAVLAECVDASHAHPLQHAAMCAVEAVACQDRAAHGLYEELADACGSPLGSPGGPVLDGHGGGGTATSCMQEEPLPRTAAVQSRAPTGPGPQGDADGVGTPPHELKRPRLEQQQQGAELHAGTQPSSLPAPGGEAGSVHPAAAQGQAATGTAALAQQRPGSAGVGGDASPAAVPGGGGGAAAGTAAAAPALRPYLCTGYDCFVVSEPCVMCAMALVHSRVARVVYARADPAHGALGGAFRLHSQRTLNHHYEVYQLPLAGEAELERVG